VYHFGYGGHVKNIKKWSYYSGALKLSRYTLPQSLRGAWIEQLEGPGWLHLVPLRQLPPPFQLPGLQQ
jgi:hypothetical protein